MVTYALMSVLVLLTAPPTSQPAAGATDKTEIRRVIDDFLKSPAKDDRAERIMKFAQDDQDVSIVLDDQVLAWMKHQPKYEQADVLLTVFVAGDVRSQLDSGKNVDDSYAGLKEVFRVYRDMQQKQANLKLTEIDALIEEDKAGTLKPFLADRAAAHRQPAGAPPSGR